MQILLPAYIFIYFSTAYNSALKIPVAAIEIITVGRRENRIIAKKVIITAIVFAALPERITGAIIEINTQPGIASIMRSVVGLSLRLRNTKKPTMRVR